jgi:hypothetical protein
VKRTLIVIASLSAISFAYKAYAKCIGNETIWTLNIAKFEQLSGPVATSEEIGHAQFLWLAAQIRMTDSTDYLSANGGTFTMFHEN